MSYSKHLIFQSSHLGGLMGSFVFNIVCNLTKFPSLSPSDCGAGFVRAMAVHRTDPWEKEDSFSQEYRLGEEGINLILIFRLMSGFPLVLSAHLAVWVFKAGSFTYNERLHLNYLLRVSLEWLMDSRIFLRTVWVLLSCVVMWNMLSFRLHRCVKLGGAWRLFCTCFRVKYS